MAERYIDPNSGAAPQPGGYGGYAAAPVKHDGGFDTAVADEVTEQQDEAAEDEKADKADKAQVKKPVPTGEPKREAKMQGKPN